MLDNNSSDANYHVFTLRQEFAQWTWNEIDQDWLVGSKIAVSPRTAVQAFNRDERLLEAAVRHHELGLEADRHHVLGATFLQEWRQARQVRRAVWVDGLDVLHETEIPNVSSWDE